jgi:HSP20 family molecular chaperone IbpA
MTPFVNLTHPIHTNIFESGQGFKFISQLIDDPWYSSHIQRRFHHKETLTTPDFDVRETADTYFLEGNFAGIVSTNDIKMEWVGGRTLVIDAKVPKLDLKEAWGVDVSTPVPEHDDHENEGNSSVGIQDQSSGPQETQQNTLQQPITDNQQQKDYIHSGDHEVRIHNNNEKEKKQPEHPSVREWLAERHVGSMQRSFTFPRDIAVEDVKAKLKNGLLIIKIPKTHKTETRSQITIES